MKRQPNFLSLVVACAVLALPHLAAAKTTTGIPPEIITPDKVETRIGTLEYKDGAPTVETAQKVYDTLDFTRALKVYNNSFRGASAYGLLKGFRSIGAKENTVVIFSELMDSNSLFLTTNADTIYHLSVVDLTKVSGTSPAFAASVQRSGAETYRICGGRCVARN